MAVVDLGITTYTFLALNCFLLIGGVLRMVVAVCFAAISIFVFDDINDISFTTLIQEPVFVGLLEEVIFLLGVLAGFKNNLRLMYTYEVFIILLIVSKMFSSLESAKNRDLLNEDIQMSLENMMNEYRLNRMYKNSKVEEIQLFFHCCGFQNPEYWLKDPNSAVEELPQTCCENPDNSCVVERSWKTGCGTAITVPPILFAIHYYTLYPVFEVILFIIGIVLIIFIKKTATNSLA